MYTIEVMLSYEQLLYASKYSDYNPSVQFSLQHLRKFLVVRDQDVMNNPLKKSPKSSEKVIILIL